LNEAPQPLPSPGDVLTNEEISRRFAVGNMGGMRRSKKRSLLVIIYDPFEDLHQNRWEGDVLHYTGMGPIGDQSLSYAQDRTLNESPAAKIPVHLLEAMEPLKYTLTAVGFSRMACAPQANDGHSFRVALAIRQPTLGLTKQHRARLWPTTSCWLRHVGGSAHPRIWYSSLADLTPRIDPYSVVIGSARRSEFQSQLACPLEGLRRITRRERHGSGYVRKASASRGGKHR
jgi:hypothetical protein